MNDLISAPRCVREITGETHVKPPDEDPEDADADGSQADVVFPGVGLAVLGEGYPEAQGLNDEDYDNS
jgi:hypothetical protein